MSARSVRTVTGQSRGFVVLGFPSNNFGNQEPGTEKQIQSFCRLTYSVEFPMFEKVGVKKGSGYDSSMKMVDALRLSTLHH